MYVLLPALCKGFVQWRVFVIPVEGSIATGSG